MSNFEENSIYLLSSRIFNNKFSGAVVLKPTEYKR